MFNTLKKFFTKEVKTEKEVKDSIQGIYNVYCEEYANWTLEQDIAIAISNKADLPGREVSVEILKEDSDTLYCSVNYAKQEIPVKLRQEKNFKGSDYTYYEVVE